MNLNERAAICCQPLMDDPDLYRTRVWRTPSGARVIDCGNQAEGGLETGIRLAETCMAGLGRVVMTAGNDDLWPGPWVTVSTDHPVGACMASQYAGWQLTEGKYFAMGSGPMRAAAGREPLFDAIGHTEKPALVVGILETATDPPDALACQIAAHCDLQPANVLLLTARTASIAGSVQIVARSLETALHKLHELDFDLNQLRSGWGTAPLPPIAGDDLHAIGRTNDAILYGALVTLWLDAPDETLRAIAPQIPSSASPDCGRPFIDIFRDYDGDFYRIDPMLFSPARVQLISVASGNVFTSGCGDREILQRSFGGTTG